MPINRDKLYDTVRAVKKLSIIQDELSINAMTFASDAMWAKIPALVEQAQAVLKEIQVLTCPHPAFAAGRCFKCNASHEEAK